MPERDPRLGDRLPRRPDLGDLDEVVHQRQAGEAGLVRGLRDVPQPAAGSSPQGKRETCRTTSSAGRAALGLAAARDARPPSGRRRRRRRRRPPSTWSQPSLVEALSHGAERLRAARSAPGQGPVGHERRCAGGTTPAGCRTRPRPPAVRPRAPVRASRVRRYDVETERVDDRRQPAAQPRRRRSGRAARTRPSDASRS